MICAKKECSFRSLRGPMRRDNSLWFRRPPFNSFPRISNDIIRKVFSFPSAGGLSLSIIVARETRRLETGPSLRARGLCIGSRALFISAALLECSHYYLSLDYRPLILASDFASPLATFLVYESLTEERPHLGHGSFLRPFFSLVLCALSHISISQCPFSGVSLSPHSVERRVGFDRMGTFSHASSCVWHPHQAISYPSNRRVRVPFLEKLTGVSERDPVNFFSAQSAPSLASISFILSVNSEFKVDQ